MIETTNFRETKLYRRLSFWIRSLVLMPLLAALFVAVVMGICAIYAPYALTGAQNALGAALGHEAVYSLAIGTETPARASMAVLGGVGTLVVWPVVYGAWFNGPLGRGILAVQRFFGAGTYSTGGAARFAGMTAEAFASYGGRKSSVYLGRSLFAPWWRLGWTPEKHLLTLAGSRGGKGAGVIIPNLLQWQGSTLTIDPKGTNTNVTAERRRKMGVKVHALDPFNVTNEKSAGFNPLDYLDPASVSIVEDIDVIASSIVPESKDERDGHFSDSASIILSGFIAHVLTSPDFLKPSMLDVRDLVHLDGEDEAYLVVDMKENDACGGLAKQAAKRIMDGRNKGEHHSVMSTLKRHMKWLNSEGYADLLRASTFNVDDMKDHPTSVFLILPPDLIGEQAGFLRLFLNVALNRYIRGGRAKTPALFMVDETASLGYVKRLPRAYRELASYNLRVWTFWQSKSDIDEIYGSEGQSFITNSDAIQCFSLADEDCDWIARMIGTRAMVDDVTRTSAVMGFRDRTSIAKEIVAPSPSDQWFGKMYVLRPGRNAHLVENVPYHRDGFGLALASPDPDFPNTRPRPSMWPAYATAKAWDSIRSAPKTSVNPINLEPDRQRADHFFDQFNYLLSMAGDATGVTKAALFEQSIRPFIAYAYCMGHSQSEVFERVYIRVCALVTPRDVSDMNEEETALVEVARKLDQRYSEEFPSAFFEIDDALEIFPERRSWAEGRG